MLSFKREMLLSANLNGESSLPPLSDMSNVQNMTESNLGEDDGLFIGYGFLDSVFPYKMQDMYKRELCEREYLTATLENDYLKAVFLPDFGGRLWSLYDKKAEKELLYHNSAIRPCNLAVRNAWLAGGIEFNCGMVGHGPFTCSTMFTAEASLEDGTPVLRMYEYERIRGIVYQMDFFLPEDSKLLYGRMRIVNPNSEVVPMYWWTNIAVPENKEYRNVVNATSAYTNIGRRVSKVSAPEHNGINTTYPTNNPIAVDYFWKIPDNERKYTAYLDKEGYGFVQSSTSRLKGRKLFVWGQGKGGSRWQEFLTKDGDAGRYVEIQAGLANTQYECLPMPPNTAWEWLECYGALQTEGNKIHGDYRIANDEVTQALENLIPEKTLEKMLTDTKNAALLPAKRTVCNGSGWGALERKRRLIQNDKELCPHLDFGEIGELQKNWLWLLENGCFEKSDKEGLPSSWMYQKEWTSLLEEAKPSYEKYIHLAAIYFVEKKLDKSREMCENALGISDGPAALYILSQIKRLAGDIDGFAKDAEAVRRLLPDDISVARMAFGALLENNDYQKIISTYEMLSDAVKKDGRVSMFYCFALLYSDRIDDAEEFLNLDGGICVDDIREGEVSITDLYIKIAEAKAKRENKPFDVAKLSIPVKFDFRMFV